MNTHERGFVLFEALISVAILSVACLFISRSLSAAVRSARISQDYYTASLHIEDALWRLDHRTSTDVSVLRMPERSDFSDHLDWTITPQVVANGNLVEWQVQLAWNTSTGKRGGLELSKYAAAE